MHRVFLMRNLLVPWQSYRIIAELSVIRKLGGCNQIEFKCIARGEMSMEWDANEVGCQ